MAFALTPTGLLRLATRSAQLARKQCRFHSLPLPYRPAKRFAHSSTSPHPEDFYEFYLEKLRIKPKGVETCPWLKKKDPEAAVEALEPALRQDPLSVLDSPACDISQVGRCLEAFVLRTHAQTESRAAARHYLLRVKPGTRALHWFLHSGRYETADPALEPRFMAYIAHCLIAEKGDDRIMTWMQSSHGPQHLEHLPPEQARHWKGVMAMHLIENNVFWANDDMNKAFIPLFKIFMFNVGPPEQPLERQIPLTQGDVWILKQLRNSSNEQVDPKQYDRFAAVYKKTRSKHRQWRLDQLDLANLSLHHPITPQADPAYQHILTWPGIDEHDPYRTRYLPPKSIPVASYILRFIVSTARMLAREDRADHARQVLDIGKSAIPGLFKMQDVRSSVQSFGGADSSVDRTSLLAVQNGRPVKPDRRTEEYFEARREQGQFW